MLRKCLGGRPEPEEAFGVKPGDFRMFCSPWKWASTLVDEASGWQSCEWSDPKNLTRNSGSPMASKPSKGKRMVFERPGGRGQGNV
jgi:hypothetical protein